MFLPEYILESGLSIKNSLFFMAIVPQQKSNVGQFKKAWLAGFGYMPHMQIG